MTWHVAGDRIPAAGRALPRWVGRTLLRCLGWRIEGAFPNEPKIMVVVAPHTSNWDFPIGMAVMFAIGIRASWMAKHTLFRPPFGGILRRMGGIPINRTAAHGVVEETIRAYRAHDQLVIGVTPEGTRKQVQAWKTGFYHVAEGARIPMVLVSFDYEHKEVRFGPSIEASGDMAADMQKIKAYFRQFKGKHPQTIP